MANRLRDVSMAAVIGLIVASPVPGDAWAQAASVNVSGKWQLTCTTKRGRQVAVALALQQNGQTLDGTYTGPRRSGPLSGSVQGTQVSFGAGAFRFNGAATGNTMTGQDQRGQPCSAARG